MKAKDFIIIGGALALFYLYQKNKTKTSTTSTETQDEATSSEETPSGGGIAPSGGAPSGGGGAPSGGTPSGGTTSGSEAVVTLTPVPPRGGKVLGVRDMFNDSIPIRNIINPRPSTINTIQEPLSSTVRDNMNVLLNYETPIEGAIQQGGVRTQLQPAIVRQPSLTIEQSLSSGGVRPVANTRSLTNLR
jgi:hypothetical protein